MKIKLIHRRPRSPMRMRHLLSTLEKIPPPHMSGNVSQLPRKRLKQAKWNEELQRPNRRLRNFVLNYSGKRTADLNLSRNLPWHFCKRFESSRSPFRIDNVRTQKGPSTIEFKIEVTAIRFWLREKLDATILPHLIEIIRPNTPHISIMHLINPMYPFFRIQ